MTQLSESVPAPPTPCPAASEETAEDGSRSNRIIAPGWSATHLWLTEDQRHELEYLVEATYPFEGCGVMIGRDDGKKVRVTDIFHARNLNVERARDRFLLAPEDFMAADNAARARGLDIVGIWHSHPDHPARPSITDLANAWEGYSYLIISTPAFGANVFRSWRLQDGKFVEETIRGGAEEKTP